MPLTLFCNHGEPGAVLDFLREHGALVEGDAEKWNASFVVKQGLMKRNRRIEFNYDREWCSEPNWSTQLSGMQSFLSSFEMPAQRRSQVLRLAKSFRFCIGIPCEPEISEQNDERLEIIHAVADHTRATIFAGSALLDSRFRAFAEVDGEVDPDAVLPVVLGALAKPVAEVRISGPDQDPTAHRTDVPDPKGIEIRARTRQHLAGLGFAPAESLPTAGRRRGVRGELRPAKDIALRSVAITLLNLWVYAPDDVYSSASILAELERLGLRRWMSPEEAMIFTLDRVEAEATHGNHMGWTQENLWGLAWVLGFEPTPPLGEPLIDGAVFRPMLGFLPPIGCDIDAYLARAPVRMEDEVKQLEDIFFCAHNAARSAQLGAKNTVPRGFDPVTAGGAIHERRHALTWALSPDTRWNDTDLRT